MESGVSIVTKSVVKNGGSDPFRIGRCRSLKSASTECKLSSRQSKRWLDRTGWGGGWRNDGMIRDSRGRFDRRDISAL